MKKHYFFYLVTFIFLVITRFIFPDYITPSITHDEMIYAANAKSLSLSATNFSQKVKLFDLKPIHHMYAEFPASLMVPGFMFIKSPILATHLLPILFSITLPFIFAWFIYEIFKDKKLSHIALLIYAVSPLLWQMSRLTYDSFFSLYFYTLGSAIYLNLKKQKSLLSIPIFFLGFFNYQGYKLLLFPLTLIIFLLKNKVASFKDIKKLKLKDYILPIFSFLLTIIFALILLPKSQTTTRLTQTIFTDQEKISQITHDSRRLSLNPTIGKYFSNDYISIMELGLNNLLGTLNPTMIFLKGEPSQSGFSAWSHGFLYLIEIVLITYGAYSMFSSKKYNYHAKMILTLFFLMLIPTIINSLSEWYLLRSLFAFTLLHIFTSFAIFSLRKNKALLIIVSAIFTISILNFTYQYYFRYPLYRSDASELHERILVEYASRNKDQTIVIYDDEPHYLYLSHLLYKNLLTKNNIANFQEKYINQVYEIDNVIYSNKCVTDLENYVEIYSTLYYPCQNDFPPTSKNVSSLMDSGNKYNISNDYFCDDSKLGRYIRIPTINSLEIDDLTNEDFCSRWITLQT